MRYSSCILKLIQNSNTHLTAEQIFLELKKTYPSLVLATVYNNLNLLYQQGKIRKISLEGTSDRYDNTIRHDHLICRRCGKLSDIHLSDFTNALEAQTGFPIDGYDLKIQYICPQCRAAEHDSCICESDDL